MWKLFPDSSIDPYASHRDPPKLSSQPTSRYTLTSQPSKTLTFPKPKRSISARAKMKNLLTKTLTLNRSLCTKSTTSTFAVKKVTKKNFDSALEDLKPHVHNADFVSVDLEMTGITSAPWRESFEFDRFDVRYLKVKDSVDKFAVIQLGVCPFRWDASKQSFIAHPHTFYVFPRKELPLDGPSHEFLCQTASLDFLARYQFDFNACIHEGISYLSRAQEEEAMKCLDLASEDKLSSAGCHLKEVRNIPCITDVLFTERIKNRFCEWLDNLSRSTSKGSQFDGSSIDPKAQMQTVFFGMHPSLKLEGFTTHQLRLIQRVIKTHFNDLAYVHVDGENSSEQKLVVYTDSNAEKNLLLKEVKNNQRKKAEAKISDAVGLRHVIDLLSSEKKLIVGHNCFLDIAHIYKKFYGPLPSTVEEFASSVHKNFPYILDTKYFLKNDKLIDNMMKKNSRSLSKAFSFLCLEIASVSQVSGLVRRSRVKVEVQVDEMSSSNWNSDAKHEAGYDAFMTGCVFAQACSHVGIDFQLLSPSSNLGDNEKLQNYTNILYTSWNNGAIVNLSTGKSSVETSGKYQTKRYPMIEFKKIVLVWGLPSNFKPQEFKECLIKVFGLTAVTSIFYLDETAAFIQFNKKELVHDFLALKETLEQKNDAISVLHPLSKLLEGGNTRAADYETYKEICSSSISRVLFADQAEEVGSRRKAEVIRKSTETSEEKTQQSTQGYITENETGKESSDSTKDSPYEKYSCVDLVDALCKADNKLRKQTITSKA